MAKYYYGGKIDYVTFTGSTGEYDITAYGAQGGSYSAPSPTGNGPNATSAGGLGAEIGGKFQLTHGEQLEIVVGGQGKSIASTTQDNGGAGGGGGTFVFGDGTGNGTGNGSYTPLLAAGGGGGAQDTYNGGAGQIGPGARLGGKEAPTRQATAAAAAPA